MSELYLSDVSHGLRIHVPTSKEINIKPMALKRNPLNADNILKACKTTALGFSTSYNPITK